MLIFVLKSLRVRNYLLQGTQNGEIMNLEGLKRFINKRKKRQTIYLSEKTRFYHVHVRRFLLL